MENGLIMVILAWRTWEVGHSNVYMCNEIKRYRLAAH